MGFDEYSMDIAKWNLDSSLHTVQKNCNSSMYEYEKSKNVEKFFNSFPPHSGRQVSLN